MLLPYKAFSVFSCLSFNFLVIESYFTQKYAQVHRIYPIFQKINKMLESSHT